MSGSVKVECPSWNPKEELSYAHDPGSRAQMCSVL